MTKHILHLITGLGVGGAEHMLEKLVLGMDRAEFRNTVVSVTGDGQIAARLRQAGIAVYSLGLTHPASLLRTILRLRRLILELKPDIMQTWLYHADLVGTVTHMTTPTNTRLLWNLRCSDMDLRQYSAGTRWVLRFLPMLSGNPLRIISNSEAGRLHHIGLGYRESGWTILPNGFDLAKFGPAEAARQQTRRELGVGDNDFLIGMIARYDPMKDHANFFAMARQLAAQRSDIHFVLVGRGCEPSLSWTTAAQAELGARLHLLGERKDVADLLPGLDVMVLTSAYGEGFPNVLGEALASGIPCVATDVGDAARILGDAGLVVPPRDPAALVAAVQKILAMPAADRDAWRQQMRRRAEQEFSLGDVIARYERLYREIPTGTPGIPSP
jgi:glycosyltransferase involved in cell wall biosynthesis